MAPFYALSDDILLDILSYFDQRPQDKSDLYHIALVSRRLSQLGTYYLLRNVTIPSYINPLSDRRSAKAFDLFNRSISENKMLGSRVQQLSTAWEFLDADESSQKLLSRLVNLQHLHLEVTARPRLKNNNYGAPQTIGRVISSITRSLQSLKIDGKPKGLRAHNGTRFSFLSFKVLKTMAIASEILFAPCSHRTCLYSLLPATLVSLTVFFDENGYMPPSLAWLFEVAEHKSLHTPSLTHVTLRKVAHELRPICISGWDGSNWAQYAADHANWELPEALKKALDRASIELEIHGTKWWGRKLSGMVDH